MKNNKSRTGALDNITSGPEDEVRAWEMIEAGRYRPRRIKGSFRGRELG